jgi:diguanylate cyclase (GGDEF)-like protein
VKNLVLAFAIVLGWSPVVWGAEAPVTLTTLQAVHAVTNAEASHAQPVAFEATVTYCRAYEKTLFVQDGGIAVYVRVPIDSTVVPGDRVLVTGTMEASFRPIVVAESVALLHHGVLPKPLPTGFDELIRAEHDSLLVTIHARVRATDLLISPMASVVGSHLQLLVDGGHIEAYVDSHDSGALKNLLDTDVEITGAAAGKFDDKMQQTGVVLFVSSLADIKVLKQASASPWSLPVTPMDQILAVYNLRDLTPRVRVHGTITYYEPGSAVVLQDGPKSLWIATHTREPLQIGDQADATGFPDAHDRLLTMSDGTILDSHLFQPATPQLVTWRQLGFWSSNGPDGHQNDLVSIEGQVVTEVREAAQDEYVLLSDGRLFTAIYRHPPTIGALPPMMFVQPGSRIRVTGICTIVESNSTNPGEEVPFNILLRSFGDIQVVAQPSLLNIRNLIIIVCALLLIVFGVLARSWTLERKVRRQTTALARIEQWRSRVLEDINGSRPLAEILEEITNLASFTLHGAYCWCQVAEGSRLGKRPPNPAALRIVQHEIPARSGPPHGLFFAACDPLTKPSALETETLSMAVGLATLAIETRRLYSNLRHRSEFDLLTDIHNRFSLGKNLEILIEDARRNAGIFGLIYIDLDQFKQVNDLYGHHTGDLYLKMVAQRLKQQLRSHDLLARLGGDEFAVLLPLVSSRARVEEIALRLEHCFNEPFVLEGHTLRGAASFGIALYPEDSSTGDGLLNAADAAMYVVKNSRKQNG